MPDRGNSIVLKTMEICDDGVTDVVQLNPPRTSKEVVWTRFVAIDEDTQADIIRLMFRYGGQDYIIRSTQPGAAMYSVHSVLEVQLPSAYQPVVEFWGATPGDTLLVYVYGYELVPNRD